MVVVAALLSVSPVFAQAARVRVVRDQAIIWNPEFTTTAATVRAGTVLETTARVDAWYEVVVPATGAVRRLGFIAASQVELVEGSPHPPERRTFRPTAAAPAPPRRPAVARRVGLFGFAQVGYDAFAASQSFDAVTGHVGGAFFGAGGEVRVRPGWFVRGSVEYFQKTGERVAVSNGQVFRLGIADRLRITPASVTVGRRFDRRQYTWYVGGGAGIYRFTEHADFADPGDDVDSTFTSYHALAGVEFPGSRWVSTALEIEAVSVPNAIGLSGASAAFGEHNLGGVEGRVKVVFGK
jgi:hypothetical protein